MKKDKSIIPPGEYCYRIVEIQDGEVLSDDIDRFGKDLREYSYGGGYKEILCPYWQRTDYGTVRCNYLEKEVIDDLDFDAHKKIMAHFGISDVYEKFDSCWELPDEIKICGINLDGEAWPDC